MNECRSYKLAGNAIAGNNTEQSQLVKASSLTSLKIIDSCNKQPCVRTHVRTQLAIANNRQRGKKNSLVKRRKSNLLVMVLINSTEIDSCTEYRSYKLACIEQSYVRTLLASTVHRKEDKKEIKKNGIFKETNECILYKIACTKQTHVYEYVCTQLAVDTNKQMKLANHSWADFVSSLNELVKGELRTLPIRMKMSHAVN